MKLITPIAFLLVVNLAIATPAAGQTADTKPGNCAIWAKMSAETVESDNRFEGHDNIAPSLLAFADAQTAKMEAGMAETYAASKAFGWDKAKVDNMIASQNATLRAGFFTSTMDKSKLYMDHVQAVYQCGNAQANPADLGQSPEAFTATLKTMAEIVRQ